MPAGHVRAPLIVPLRLPVEGQYKNSIDSSTQVEISTDTPLARVYFTIDGSRPDPTSWKPRHPQSGPTYLFRGPFTLPAGAKTIKALAFIPDTNQESNVVTKTFDVLATSGEGADGNDPCPGSDDYDFLDELKNNKTKANKVEVEKNSKEVGDVVRKSSISKSPEGRLTKAVETTSWAQDRFPVISVEGDKPKKVSPNVNLCRINRLQRAVDIFNCPTCLASRPVDTDAAFCATCGTSLPRLPSPIIAPAQKIANSNVCITCGSRMVVNANKCLVCESPKGHLKKALIGEPDSMDRRLCSACGSLNPTRVKFCLTCEAVLPLTATNLINISSLLRNPQKSPSPPPPPTSTNTTFSSRLVAGCRICSRQNSLGARFCDWCGIQEPCDVDLASQLQSYAVCPKCYWQTPRDSRFCSQCGFGFAGASETSSVCDFSLGPNTRASESGNHSLVSLTPRANRTVSTQTVGLFHLGGGHSKPLVSPDHPIKSPPRSRPHMMGFVSPGKVSCGSVALRHDTLSLDGFLTNQLVYADVDESQPEEVSLCFTFKRHSSLPRACAFVETTETSTGVVEDGDRMSPSFPTTIPRSRRQTNNNNASDISHPLRAASTPISHCGASYASGNTTKSIPSPSVDQPFRSSSPKSNITDEVLHRGLDKLQESSGSFMKDSSLGHEEDANTVDQTISQRNNTAFALVTSASASPLSPNYGSASPHKLLPRETRSEGIFEAIPEFNSKVEEDYAQRLAPYDSAVHVIAIPLQKSLQTMSLA
uniref:Ankyrin repeat containing protein C20orf12 n=1 Tax=Echinococcus granulosus TaxID=6210 RepID=A0A068WSX6_ECHGR|nr:ankyrin repeat containing protein C20orf12 [Echinococcus granulosus]